MMLNSVCHVEIKTTDLEKTGEFLSGLFGWEFQKLEPGYWVFPAPEGPGGGIEKVDAPAGTGGIQLYIHVGSIEETIEKARSLGGETEKPKTEIGGGHGFYALLKDPGGTVIGVWQAQES
jgi:predicted enzyme related to lactoylglutathione lyase